MSFKFSAANSSRIKKSSKAPAFKRNGSSRSGPFSSVSKPLSRSTKTEASDDADEDWFDERLNDIGLVKALATDLRLRDVTQTMLYVREKMWSPLPDRGAGMNSTKIADVLNFRAALPPVVTISHVQALLDSPTIAEREIAGLIKDGVLRKVIINGRGHMGEMLIMTKDLYKMIQKTDLEAGVKNQFVTFLQDDPTGVILSRDSLPESNARALLRSGFLTSSSSAWTITDAFSRPRDASKGRTYLDKISKAGSGSTSAVGGDRIVHVAGGGGRVKLPAIGDYSISIPCTGPFLKLLSAARAHLLALLKKSCRYKEAPESFLKQKWDGGIAANDAASAAKAKRGEFAGVLPGRTRKWKQFYGLSFEFILGECVGAGLVEVFNTRSIGRGIRAL